MADNIEFIIKLRGGQGAAAEAKKVGHAVEEVGGKMRRVGDESMRASKRTGALGGSLKHLALGLGAVGAGYAAWNSAKNAITFTGDLTRNSESLSHATKMSIGQSSNLIAVAESAGVSSQKLAQVFTKLGAATVKTAESTGKHKTALGNMGISAAEAKAHLNDTAGMIDLVTHRLSTSHIPALQKAHMMTELFGRSWLPLGRLFLSGESNFKKLTQMAKDFGLELGGNTTESLKRLKEQQEEYTLATMGLKVRFTEVVAGPLGRMLSGFARLTVYAKKGQWTNFDKEVGKIAKNFELLAERVMPRVAGSFAKIAPAVLKAFVKGFISAPIGSQLLMAGILASKLGLVGGIFKGIGSNMGKALSKGMVTKAPEMAAAGTVLGTAFEVAFGLAAIAGVAYISYKAGMLLRKVLGLGGTEYVDPAGMPLSKGDMEAERKRAAHKTRHDRRRIAGEHLHPHEGPHHLFRKTFGHAAMGGTTLTGGMVEVGERGPEILNLPPAAKIAPLQPGSLTDNRPIILKVDGRVLARVNRRETLQSQAAGA